MDVRHGTKASHQYISSGHFGAWRLWRSSVDTYGSLTTAISWWCSLGMKQAQRHKGSTTLSPSAWWSRGHRFGWRKDVGLEHAWRWGAEHLQWVIHHWAVHISGAGGASAPGTPQNTTTGAQVASQLETCTERGKLSTNPTAWRITFE
jgi:hypothetical protein